MHALWLRPGSHFMQLAPYGFSPDGEHLIRGDYYNLVAAVAGCTTRWDLPLPSGRQSNIPRANSARVPFSNLASNNNRK